MFDEQKLLNSIIIRCLTIIFTGVETFVNDVSAMVGWFCLEMVIIIFMVDIPVVVIIVRIAIQMPSLSADKIHFGISTTLLVAARTMGR